MFHTRRSPSFGSPQPASRLARLPLQLPELLRKLERKPGVRKPVRLADDFGVHEAAIFEVDMARMRPYLSRRC
jgi:hypothetical protein